MSRMYPHSCLECIQIHVSNVGQRRVVSNRSRHGCAIRSAIGRCLAPKRRPLRRPPLSTKGRNEERLGGRRFCCSVPCQDTRSIPRPFLEVVQVTIGELWGCPTIGLGFFFWHRAQQRLDVLVHIPHHPFLSIPLQHLCLVLKDFLLLCKIPIELFRRQKGQNINIRGNFQVKTAW